MKAQPEGQRRGPRVVCFGGLSDPRSPIPCDVLCSSPPACYGLVARIASTPAPGDSKELIGITDILSAWGPGRLDTLSATAQSSTQPGVFEFRTYDADSRLKTRVRTSQPLATNQYLH